MHITFLGTGTSQGVPVIACRCKVCLSHEQRDKRLRTSALITDNDGNNILIDIGPDFRMQMLTHNVQHLEAILVTHAHRDHVGGIDDIRPFNWVQKQNMDIYANRQALDTLRHDYHYIFDYHQYPGLPEATLHDVGDCRQFCIGRVVVTPVKGMHKDLPVLGFRLDETGKDGVSRETKSLAYITDMNHIEPQEIDKLKGLDLLVINALRKEKHFSHFCLGEALDVISQCKPKRSFLTHMSHEMGLHNEVDSMLPENVHLAYDNLKITV